MPLVGPPRGEFVVKRRTTRNDVVGHRRRAVAAAALRHGGPRRLPGPGPSRTPRAPHPSATWTPSRPRGPVRVSRLGGRPGHRAPIVVKVGSEGARLRRASPTSPAPTWARRSPPSVRTTDSSNFWFPTSGRAARHLRVGENGRRRRGPPAGLQEPDGQGRGRPDRRRGRGRRPGSQPGTPSVDGPSTRTAPARWRSASASTGPFVTPAAGHASSVPTWAPRTAWGRTRGTASSSRPIPGTTWCAWWPSTSVGARTASSGAAGPTWPRRTDDHRPSGAVTAGDPGCEPRSPWRGRPRTPTAAPGCRPGSRSRADRHGPCRSGSGAALRHHVLQRAAGRRPHHLRHPVGRAVAPGANVISGNRDLRAARP